MGEVVDLGSKREEQEADGPHLAGEAFCKCGHEWAAVAPVGTVTLDCPKCGRNWGAWKAQVEPSGQAWRCNCGEMLFWLTPAGAMCRGCGVISSDWAN